MTEDEVKKQSDALTRKLIEEVETIVIDSTDMKLAFSVVSNAVTHLVATCCFSFTNYSEGYIDSICARAKIILDEIKKVRKE